MILDALQHTFKRYQTLRTNTISALPVVILMPHSACNCQCAMCDIWQGNKNVKQLTENDVADLLVTLKKFGTRQVLMSGGEALLHANFFRFCEMLRRNNIKVSLLSTGLLLKKHAANLVELVNDIIVSLDGDESTHNRIRRVPDAFGKLKDGIRCIRTIDPFYKITGRTVIHRLNFRQWPAIIESAKELGLHQISFLPADVSSQAFNRDVPWDDLRQNEIRLDKAELPEMQSIIDELTSYYKNDFDKKFIAETPGKIQRIHDYYAAFYGFNPYPYKKCNAPWVSTVIEADGNVRPCFFHSPIGNIRKNSLTGILNSEEAIHFRKTLDMDSNTTCLKCVCYLNLRPGANL